MELFGLGVIVGVTLSIGALAGLAWLLMRREDRGERLPVAQPLTRKNYFGRRDLPPRPIPKAPDRFMRLVHP